MTALLILKLKLWEVLQVKAGSWFCWVVFFSLPNNCVHDHLTVFCAQSNVTAFPGLSKKFAEYDVIITDGDNGQTYKNKIQVVINQNNPFSDSRVHTSEAFSL